MRFSAANSLNYFIGCDQCIVILGRCVTMQLTKSCSTNDATRFFLLFRQALSYTRGREPMAREPDVALLYDSNIKLIKRV